MSIAWPVFMIIALLLVGVYFNRNLQKRRTKKKKRA